MATLSGVYTIQQKSSSRFLDAHQKSNNDFSAVTREIQNDDTQKWILVHRGNDSYTIQQKSTSRFLDAHQRTDEDFSIVTREAQNNDTQIWLIKSDGNNSFTIQQKSSSRFVDAHQQSKDDFSAVTREAQNNDTQKWIIKKDERASADKKIHLRLMDVKCRVTEDSGPFGSKDELTVIWGGFFGKKAVTNSWRLKGIDDGDKKFFPADKTSVFDGSLSPADPVELIISLWDRDHGEGAEDYRKVFNDSIAAVAASGAAATPISGPVGGAITGIAAVAKAIDLSGIAAKIATAVDPDDDLGQEKFEESMSTLPVGKKDHVLRFRKNGADYTVRIQTDVS